MGQDSNNQELLLITNISTNALPFIIKMAGYENLQQIHMSLFASKVLWHVAPNIKIAMIPSSMQMVCSFYMHKGKASHPLLILLHK